MLDPICGLNPHDGSLLFEVPGDRMVVRHDANRLHIGLDEAGLRAYANAAEAKLPLDVATADKKATHPDDILRRGRFQEHKSGEGHGSIATPAKDEKTALT